MSSSKKPMLRSSDTTTASSSRRLRPSYKQELLARNFSIYQTLGTGSYSKVKLGFDFTNNRQVALKIVDKHKAPQDYQTRFLPRELLLWPQLRHKHLTQFYETFETSHYVYMILQYSSNGDMLAYVQDHGALPDKQARRWFGQVLDAVAYMHNISISHRDLKLENLLLDYDGNIRICDFGFTKLGYKDDLSQTYCGSKSYASPEILMGKPYDPFKSDSWALGVILYIFVTGKMPFDEAKGTKRILEDQRDLVHMYWPKRRVVSTQSKSLIHWAFTWDFCERPCVQEMQHHPWICTENEATPSNIASTNSRSTSHRHSPVGHTDTYSTDATLNSSLSSQKADTTDMLLL